MRHGQTVYILVYVDDILVVGDGEAIQGVNRRLSILFTVTDLGSCKQFLGFKIERIVNRLFPTQKPFAERTIDLAGMTNAKAI